MHVVVVSGQQLGVDDDLADVLGAHAVTGGEVVEREIEAVAPLRPHLVDVGDTGDVVVLYARRVPDEPRDGVGLGLGAEGRGLGVEVAGQLTDELVDAAEAVDEQLARRDDLT
ncbi:hypothetical protein GCM10007298_00930 [Williamsia phyllosphaerae]|uniref:Uncharacterized protein n=1 Tax=Williamsia phyllosphaerae TaxID=885042 RepID=A0ABQ1U3G6_9NOCA|nr:hypothetical protein GCM10007298_00930 [Williamsia phyllosphaerae]